MATSLTLSQVVDSAIGIDIPSVNFLHLKQALVTVITVLDLGDILVGQTTHFDTEILNNDLHDEMVLSDEDDDQQEEEENVTQNVNKSG